MEVILTMFLLLVLGAVFVMSIVSSIIGLCNKYIATKKKMLITSIVSNSVLILFDTLTLLITLSEQNIALAELMILLPFFFTRTGLFTGQLINYLVIRKKQPYITPIPTTPKRSNLYIIFLILSIISEVGTTGCILILFFFIFTAMFGAWGSDLEEYLATFGIASIFCFISMIVSIILFIVFKKKENRRRLGA